MYAATLEGSMTAADTRNLPEPREGVNGVDRTRDPLLTSNDAKPLIARLARQLWSAYLGHPFTQGSVYHEQYKRMSNPEPGDQVVVYDAVVGSASAPNRLIWAVGYLLVRRAEWWHTHEEWEREKAEDGTLTDDDRPIEHTVWYVQYGPNPDMVCRWVNCKVITIPTNEV